MDMRLRRLERSYAASKSPESLSLLVRERLRLGVIAKGEALELAAEFGHPLALEIVGPIFYRIQNPILRFLSLNFEVYDHGHVDDSWFYSKQVSAYLYVSVLRACLPLWDQAFQEQSKSIPNFIPETFPQSFFVQVRPWIEGGTKEVKEYNEFYDFIKFELLKDGYLTMSYPETPPVVSGICEACHGLLAYDWCFDYLPYSMNSLFQALSKQEPEELLIAPEDGVIRVLEEAKRLFCDWAFGNVDLL